MSQELEITEFKPKYVYGKNTKKDIFEATVRQFQRNEDNREIEGLTLFFKLESLKSLTKTPTALLNDLLNSKMVIKQDGRYVINNTKVYCKVCYEKAFNEAKIRGENLYIDYTIRFHEYEIVEHLERAHYFNYRGYDGKQEISEHNRMTPERIAEYISYTEPKFEIKEHNYEVTEIDNSRLDRVFLTLKCKNCNDEVSIVKDVSTCTKEVTTQ